MDLVRLFACLAGIAAPAAARAAGYLVEDGGLRTPAAYAADGESVLVGPGGSGGSGTFEAVADAGTPEETDEAVVPEGLGAGWDAGGCTACSGQGCAACTDAAGDSGIGGDGGAGHGGSGHGRCGHGRCGPRWAVQVDALMLWQGNIASRPLFAADTGLTALDANQAYPSMSAGPRVGLFYFVGQTHAIEGNYFNVRPFDGAATTLPGQVLTEQNLAGFSLGGFDGAEVFTNGSIQSAELNWRRRECGSPVTWLAGFRWVEWNQQMRITESSAGPVGSFLTDTGNDLYGGQLGLDLDLWDAGGPFTLHGVGKAGAFSNVAYQRTSFTNASGTRSAAAAVDRLAFFGEVGVNGSLRLTQWLAWRVGYSCFWLSGVAVPANQLAATALTATPPTATVNTGGSVLLHGVTTGLEARW